MTGTLKTTLIQNPSSADVNITLGTTGNVTLAKSPVLNGSTSGTITIAAPAVAGTNTLTLPAVTDTLVGIAAAQTLTNKTIQGGAITSGTAQVSTSGTSIDFTGIPSWVKRITVMFNGVSTNGTSDLVVQLGTGATPTYTTSGYVSAGSTSAGTTFNATTGFAVAGAVAAANAFSGSILISTLGSNIWVSSGNVTTGNGSQQNSGGVTLAAVVTALRITTVGGVNTFDAGSINIMYE